MAASRCCRRALLACGLVFGRAAWAQQAELTTLLDSGDVLGAAPAEPALWDGLGSLRSGHDNRARLTLKSDALGVLPGLTTSALLRLELGLGGLGEGAATALQDASSSVGLAWQSARGPRFELSAYPFDTDYLRLGYLHALDWGGTHVGRRESVFLAPSGGAPGVALELRTARLRLSMGLKWAKVDQALAGPRRRWGAALAGRFDLSSDLRVEAGFGFFQRLTGFVEGASLRLVWHRGVREPEVTAEPFRPPSLSQDPLRLDAEAPMGSSLALEGVLLVARTAPREVGGAETLVPAPAGALYGSLRGSLFAGHAVLSWRSLAFVLRNDARFAQDSALPAAAAEQPELAAWVGGSISLLPVRLVPSIELGTRLPAALQTVSALPGAVQTWVAGGTAGFEALPLGAGRLPVLAARVGLRFQASTSLGLSAQADYQRSPNRVRLVASSAEQLRTFDAPDSLAFVGAVQARF